MNKQAKKSYLVLLLIGIASMVLIAGCSNDESDKTNSIIKLGWQPPWANQGQLVAILMRDDFQKKYGIEIEFIPFTYGAPMIEAAISGSLDIVFAGDQPIFNLASQSKNWKIASKLIQYRSAVIVPSESKIFALEELNGESIAAGIGSTTHRDLVGRLRTVGLDQDISIAQLDVGEHVAYTLRGGNSEWNPFPAVATYDPSILFAVKSGNARVIDSWASPGLVGINDSSYKENKSHFDSFFIALRAAFVEYSKNPHQANLEYGALSRIELSDKDYASLASIDTNLSASHISEVHIGLDKLTVEAIGRNLKLSIELGVVKNRVSVQDIVHPEFVE